MSRNVADFFRALFLAAACHLTDVSLGGIKIGEIAVLLLVPFVLRPPFTIGKKNLFWISFFSALLISTFIINLTTRFYPPQDIGILKLPYFISISRFVELLLCLFAFSFASRWGAISGRASGSLFVDLFVKVNIAFGIVIILMWIFSLATGVDLGVLDGESYRLKGFFVEGGPLGLFAAAFVIFVFYQPKRNFTAIAVYVLLILASQSKAGILLLLTFVAFQTLSRRFSFKVLIFSLFLGGLLSFAIIFAYGEALLGYFENVTDVEIQIGLRPDDPSLVMGRIAGAFIGRNIFELNPVFGVGLGNYSLVRNDPRYLGFFPPVDEWDLTGLGFFTLLVEGGLIFSLIFCWLYMKTMEVRFRSDSLAIKLLPLFCFLLGVQIYFLYPWVFMGFLFAAYSQNKEIRTRPFSSIKG